jgi:HEAT repeat protein
MRGMNQLRAAATCWLLVCLCLRSARAAEDVIDSPMYRLPEIPLARVVKTYPAGLAKLWLEAFERPEADYKVNAAQAIAAAHQRGMKGLEATIAPLLRELDKPDVHPTVRLAIILALVTLDARDTAPALLRLASSGDIALRELIDPALARWDHGPARAGWLERLEKSPHKRATVLAIQALLAVREDKSCPLLRTLVFSRDVVPAARFEAARALGILRPAGSDEDARQLTADASPRGMSDRLAAALLLRQHKGDGAVKLLLSLAKDPEPAVAAIALTRLIEIDSKHVEPLLESVLSSADAKVRGLGVETLFQRASADHIGLLGDRLSDPHPEVRSQARRAMSELHRQAAWRESVNREATRVLDGNDWRGLEQATIVLAQVNHKPAASRLLELLASQRPEVCIASAWGLRLLAVPETLPAALGHFRSTLADPKIPREAVDPQLCQLAQFFGFSKYKPADAALRAIVPPRTPAGFETRAAAIWALGLIHERKPDAGLVGLFAGRVSAVRPFDVEDSRVRRMSAVSLGRMKAEGALATLREFFRAKKQSLDVVNNACGWAIEQIMGEPMPPGQVEISQLDWFLIPSK